MKDIKNKSDIRYLQCSAPSGCDASKNFPDRMGFKKTHYLRNAVMYFDEVMDLNFYTKDLGDMV